VLGDDLQTPEKHSQKLTAKAPENKPFVHLAICLVCCRVFPLFMDLDKKTVLLLVGKSRLGWVLVQERSKQFKFYTLGGETSQIST